MTLFSALRPRPRSRTRLSHQFRPSFGDQLALELRIALDGAAAADVCSSTTCDDVTLDFALSASPDVTISPMQDGKFSFRITNNTTSAQTYTIAAYKFAPGHFGTQTLDDDETVTFTVAACSTCEYWVCAKPCTQYDLIHGDACGLPRHYDAGDNTPPGDPGHPLVDTRTRETIPVLAAVVTSCDCECECPPDGGKQKGNEGLGNGADPPPPGHDTNQNDSDEFHPVTPGNPDNKGKKK